jgi:hypothetical protein
MKRFPHVFALLAILGVVFVGCSQNEDPVAVDTFAPGLSLTMSSIPGPTVVTSTVINGFNLQFDGRTYANDQTTFSYTVTGENAPHSLSNFFLELPDCAPALASFTPAGGTIGLNPLTGLYGIKWDISLGPNESRSYSITFQGDVPLGAILAAVKASDVSPLGEIAGPCDGFEISGTVYVDADASGAQNGADEPGIADVTVALVDGGGNVLNSTTDVNGDYSFIRYAGTYTARIDTATTADDFNEVLNDQFTPTGPTSAVVIVGPDSPDNDFGYEPEAEKITFELEAGILLTTGEGPKYWIKQLRGGGKTDFDSATMAAFLTEIQGLFLPEPFQFTPGNELKEAINILKSKSKDPLDQLTKELLAAEFNEVSGKGIVGEEELQSVLLAWVESLIAQSSSAGPAAAATKGDDRPQRAIPTTSIEDALGLLKGINGATGGGGSGGEG